MPISSIQPGYSIIQQSSKMSEEAAQDIRNNQTFDNERAKNDALQFNSAENYKMHRSKDDIEPHLKLNQATQYHRIGTNVIQREQDMIGSLLDLHI